MPIAKSGWAAALEPGIREWFSVGYEGLPSMMEQFFTVLSSSSDAEHYHSFGSIPPEIWDNFKNSGKIPSVDFSKGYQTNFVHDEFLAQIEIRRTMIEDNKYSQIADWAGQLGESARLKREIDASSVFNNAFTAGYVGGDGVVLCSDAHPASPDKSSYTQDNALALALTPDNVETARQAMMGFTDDVGNVVGSMPDLLLVPVALENTAKNITQAAGLIGSADNDINPQQGRFTYKVWPRLTDADAWFLIDSAKMRRSLLWFDRIAAGIHRENKDETVWANFIGRARYSYGWRDWRWILGSNAG